MDVDTYGFTPHTMLEKMEWILAQFPLMTSLKTHSGQQIQSWDGYIATAADLRRIGNKNALKAVTKAILDRYPAHSVPEELKNLLRPGRATTQPSTTTGPVATSPTPYTPPQPSYAPVHATEPPTVRPDAPAPQPEQDNAWAVVKIDSAPAYTEDGNHFMDVPAGTLLTIHNRDKSRSGDPVSIGRIMGGNGTVVIMRTASLDEQRGSLSHVSIDERTLRVRRAKLLAALKAQPDAHPAENGLPGNNPHTTTYRKARKEYLAFGERVRKLTEGMNNATGAKRMDYANELRTLKGEDARLKAAYDTAGEQYKAWKNSHLNTGRNGARITSSRNRLEAELTDVERELRQL